MTRQPIQLTIGGVPCSLYKAHLTVGDGTPHHYGCNDFIATMWGARPTPEGNARYDWQSAAPMVVREIEKDIKLWRAGENCIILAKCRGVSKITMGCLMKALGFGRKRGGFQPSRKRIHPVSRICPYCGKPAKRYNFKTRVTCCDPECLNKAHVRRGEANGKNNYAES